MQMRRAVLFKPGSEPKMRDVGCPDPRSTEPYEYVMLMDELYVRNALSDLHDGSGRICAYRHVDHYEI